MAHPLTGCVERDRASYRLHVAQASMIGLIALTGLVATAASKGPPVTRKDNVKDVLHGVEIVDPYRWLEDQNSPETRAWIDAQNAHTDSILKARPGRDRIRRRLEALMKIDRVGIPIARGGRYFFMKRRADQELSVIYMREGLDGPDKVLIDPHPMSPDHTVSVNLRDVTRDGSLMAYAVRQGGEDEVEIRLFDVNRGQDLPDRLPKGRYMGVSILPDRSGLYYTRHDEHGPRVFHRKLGTAQADDRMIFGEGYDSGKGISSALSQDGRYLLMEVWHGWVSSEVYVQRVADGSPIVPIVNDLEARFSGDIVGDQLFLQTNWQAPNGRMLVVDLNDPARDKWREIVPTGDAVIRDFSLVGGKLCVSYLENVRSRVAMFRPDGTHLGDIAFPSIGTVSGMSGRWDRDEAFFSFGSFHIPSTSYRYDLSTGKRDVWAKLDIPIDPEKFEVKQVWYTSKDGTRIPMFLVHARGLIRNGRNPTLLTGYGGFNISLTPRFSAGAALFVEAGGVYARPNLRGGGEFGEDWHRAGMNEKKQNVFDDFHAAAEWLIRNGYTQPDKLAIAGGSNGGLLVGAALTQRPELFRAVVCIYPLLDMVRYHKFLVARFWIPEYGSSDDAEQFRYIHAYSPYHRVRKGVQYPAVLFITGDADTRVAPLHARKMTALLQDATGSDRPVLLHYDTKAGHSGGKPLSQQVEDRTDEFSFLFEQLGVTY